MSHFHEAFDARATHVAHARFHSRSYAGPVAIVKIVREKNDTSGTKVSGRHGYHALKGAARYEDGG